MTYLRPALANVRFRRALDSGLQPEAIGNELARLATLGGCAPKDLSAFLKELGSPGSPWAESAPAIRRSVTESVERHVSRSGWKSIGGACLGSDQLLARETESLRELGRNKEASRADAFVLAIQGAKSLDPIPNALSLAKELTLEPAALLAFKGRLTELLADGSVPLPQATVAALAKGQVCEGHEFIPARLQGVALSASKAFGEEGAKELASRLRGDLQRVKGLHYTQQRLLTQLETYNTAVLNYGTPHDFLRLAAERYNPGDTAKGRERETRAFFSLLSEAAQLMRDKQAGDHGAAKRMNTLASQLAQEGPKSASLRQIRSGWLNEAGAHRATRIGTAFARLTSRPARTFSTGLRVASPKTVEVAHDLVISSRSLDSYASECEPTVPRAALAEAMSAFADGVYSEWKYSHCLAKHQLAHLSPAQVALWKEDHSWSLPFEGPGATRLRARETSDLRESLYFADRPVASCASLLGDGSNGYTAVSVSTDANKKVVFIEDHLGNVVGRTLVRTCFDDEGEPLIVVETAYSSVGNPRFCNQLQAGVVAGLGKKFAGDVEIAAGICMTDADQVCRANDILGFAEYDSHTDVSLPTSLAGYEYVDSSLLAGSIVASNPKSPEVQTVRSAILRNADRAAGLPDIDETYPATSPWGAEERFTTRTQAKLSTADAILNRLFPNRDERIAFAQANPECLPTGDVPHGSESMWREVLINQPVAAQFLHHAEFATAILRGHPDPARKGEDFREAVAIAEAQPLFASLISGLSRTEIASLRDQWHAGIVAQVQAGPAGSWPPPINVRDLVPSLTPALSPAVADAFLHPKRQLRALSSPNYAPSQSPALS